MSVEELLAEMFGPVWQASHALRLADREATRTDPWRWYCRSCNAEGQSDDEETRDRDACAHVAACPHRGLRVRTEAHGRLRHVWGY